MQSAKYTCKQQMDDREEPSSRDDQLKPFIEPATIKAFVAGLVIGNINKGLLLGFSLGALGGIFVQQNFTGVPDLTNLWRDIMNRWTRTK